MKFIHTADWQLGLKLKYVPGDAGARARAARFDTVRRIAELARARGADCVLVAGDVFDDNAVGEDTLAQAHDALAAFAPTPVLLLPGNHDHAGPGSVWSRLWPAAHVRALTARKPLDVAGATVYPCPLLRRHERDDPTAWLPARGAADGIRVAVAHGGVIDFAGYNEAPNLIDARRVLGLDFDYLALGDWHSKLCFDARAWYPGAPEATRFKETDPGHVLWVEIPAPGALPRVEAVPVARCHWRRHVWHFDGDVTVRKASGDGPGRCPEGAETQDSTELRHAHGDSQALKFGSPDFGSSAFGSPNSGDAGVRALRDWLAALPERSWTLLELRLNGELGLAARAELDALLAAAGAGLLHLRVKTDALTDAPSAGELDALNAEGFVGQAARRLAADPDPAARDALRLLYRLVRES